MVLPCMATAALCALSLPPPDGLKCCPKCDCCKPPAFGSCVLNMSLQPSAGHRVHPSRASIPVVAIGPCFCPMWWASVPGFAYTLGHQGHPWVGVAVGVAVTVGLGGVGVLVWVWVGSW